MLADPEFVRTRATASGAVRPDAQVEGTPADGFTISIRQQVPSTTLPVEFRSFVGAEITVRYTEVWESLQGDDRTGTFALEIVGAPGHASGSLALVPDPDGTRFVAAGAVVVRMPLVGAMIERAVADALIRGMRAELAAADTWLEQPR